MIFALVPPWILPKVTTTGSRESIDRGTNW